MIWWERNSHPSRDQRRLVSVWLRLMIVLASEVLLSEVEDYQEMEELVPGNCRSASKVMTPGWQELVQSRIFYQCTEMLECPAPEIFCSTSSAPCCRVWCHMWDVVIYFMFLSATWADSETVMNISLDILNLCGLTTIHTDWLILTFLTHVTVSKTCSAVQAIIYNPRKLFYNLSGVGSLIMLSSWPLPRLHPSLISQEKHWQWSLLRSQLSQVFTSVDHDQVAPEQWLMTRDVLQSRQKYKLTK